MRRNDSFSSASHSVSASSDSGDEGANPARNDRRNNDAEAAVEVAKEAIIEQRQPQVRLSIAPDKPRNGGKRLIEINQEAWRDVPEDQKLDSYYYYQARGSRREAHAHTDVG